jgi:hypothetical protein
VTPAPAWAPRVDPTTIALRGSSYGHRRLGSDGSGRGIRDIAGTPCGQSQSRAGSDSVPSAIRTRAHQCRHTAETAAAAVDPPDTMLANGLHFAN